ncbi:AMP-binding protein [Streptomyces rimosus]|uniref:non-ribosomal peptide synthetase n=1 Tax=Streptomyces rimosus TaxID=1927 RepID=UPI000AFBCD3E|nr:non-ribosomal peptide synthetase [Streptomyces rimosus]
MTPDTGETRAAVDVLELFEQQVRTAPERTALAIGGHTFTYGQLHSASAELARRIAYGGGVRPGSGQVVALHLRQSARTVVGMLAALRLGLAWYVVEPGPHAAGPAAERLRAALADTDCAAVVFDGTDPATAPEAVAAAAPRTPRIDLSGPDGTAVSRATAAGTAPRARVPGSAPAYVIGTAGSTGAPKAVVVGRDALAQLMAVRPEEPGVTTFSPCRLAWDGSLVLLFHALCTGGTAVLPDARELPDAARSAALITTWQARQIAAPPSFYRLLLPHLAGADRHLRRVILGGEPVPATLVAAHRRTLPGTRLRNEYGPTEATVGVIAYDVPDTPESPAADSGLPIGCPIGPATRAYVLGRDLRPVPDGTLGELYLGGPQVALGYAGRPAETAGRFVADPYAGAPGARMYRTGDLARAAASGVISFAGREDGQVKVRGARIERHAVEAVVESHPGVGRACVLAVPDERMDMTLVAFWTAGPRAEAPEVRELLAHCASRLAAHAVPERFVKVADVPLTPQGKTDEDALRALLAEAEPCGSDGGAANGFGTELEQQVAALWAGVLRHDGFGPDDGFFAAGGNSRRVVELHMGLERRWPGAVRVGQLFDLVTVRDQAEAVGRALAGSDGPAGAPAAFEV